MSKVECWPGSRLSTHHCRCTDYPHWMFVIVVTVFTAFCGFLTIVNAAQVPLGRMVFSPSSSRRTPRQIRQQSLAAAISMGSLTLIGVLLLMDGSVVLLVLALLAAVLAHLKLRNMVRRG